MAKKKKQANNVAFRKQNENYACPHCHAQNAVKVTIKKNDAKTKLEGHVFCKTCKKSNILQSVDPLDTPNNVYARWCDYMR